VQAFTGGSDQEKMHGIQVKCSPQQTGKTASMNSDYTYRLKIFREITHCNYTELLQKFHQKMVLQIEIKEMFMVSIHYRHKDIQISYSSHPK